LGLQALSLFGMKGVSPGRQPPVKKTTQPLQGLEDGCGNRSGSKRGLGLLISGGGIIGNVIETRYLFLMKIKDLRKPFLRWAMSWPGDSTRFGPPRLPPFGLEQIARDDKGEIPELIPVHPRGRIIRSRPAVPIGSGSADVFDIPESPQTPTFLARIPKGRLLGPTIAVITGKDRVVADVSLDWNHPPDAHYAYRRFRLPRCKNFQGDAVVLACTGADTYYHWLIDALPRVAIARTAWNAAADPDWWVVNSLKPSFVAESLQALGIPRNKVVSLEENPHVCFSNLWVPSLPCSSSSGNPPVWVAHFLSDLAASFCTDSSAREEAIFIERKGLAKRNLKLSDKQREKAGKAGFAFVALETLPWREQVSLFRRANRITGPHGAGFSNVIFSHGAKVLEFFPKLSINACYYALSCHSDCPYGYVVASQQDQSGAFFVSDSLWDEGLAFLSRA